MADRTGRDPNLNLMLTVARLAEPVDCDGYLRAIERDETVAPVLQPSAYQRGRRRLGALKQLTKAVKQVQVAYAQLQKEAAEEIAAWEGVPPIEIPTGRDDG